MKISVIIPCYNQSSFIEETCQSIINQKYTNWEVLLINDGSTDNTEKICRKISSKDSRFIYYYKNNGGLSSARNYGLDKASGDYIQFLDSDDILETEKLSESLKTDFDIIISNFKMLEKNKKVQPFCDLQNQKFSFESILLNWDNYFSIPIHCGLFSKKIIGNTRFNENLKAKEDWFFWLTLFHKSPKVTFINKFLALYRLHDTNMCKDVTHMSSNTKKAYELIYKWLDEKHKLLFFNKLAKNLIEEKEKSEYLFREKNKIEIAKKQLEYTLKKNIIYKVLFKIEYFVRKIISKIKFK